MNNKLSLLVNFVGIDKMSGSLKNIIGLGRKGSRSLNQLRGEGRKLERQLREVRKEIKDGSGDIAALTARERALGKAINGVNNQISERKRLNAIEGDKRAMMRRGDDLKNRGRDNMVQGASLAAPLILATKEAAEFSSGMVDIQQKAELTNRQADQLGATIVQMAADAKQMPENIRSGLDLLLGKGMKLDVATQAIGPASRLATAFKVELPDAANAAYASINNLKVASGSAGAALDAMAAAGNEGGFEVRDMARHFPALTAQMQALGEEGVESVADLSAALQVAMHTAGSADEAGNNVKNLLAKINAPASIRAFKKNFGVDLPAAMQKLTEQGYSSLEAITMITKQATGGDMKKLGFAFEDMQARQGIMALIQNFEEYRRIRQAAMNSGGTVDKAFGQRAARDAMVNWTAFKSSASQLAITLGAGLLPVATEAMDMISGIGGGIARWAKENPKTAATLMKLVAGLAVFKIGLGAAQFAFGGLLGPMAKGIALMRKMGGVASVFYKLRFAALALGKGIMKAGMLMLANPIVLAIVALVAVIGFAGYMIYKHWDTIKAAFWKGVAAASAAWTSFKNFMASALSWMIQLPLKFSLIGRDIILGIVRGISGSGGAVWSALKRVVLGGVNRVKEFLGINSPSRLFMEIGGHTADGMAIGIDRGRRRVEGAGRSLAAGLAAAGALAMQPATAATSVSGSNGPSSTRSAGSGMQVNITIRQQPGESADELADRIVAKLEEKDRSNRRRSYEDEQ